MSIRNLYLGSNDNSTLDFWLDGKRVSQMWLDGVCVWNVTETKDFIINLAQVSGSMSVTIDISNLMLMTSFPYTYMKNGTIDWGDGSSTLVDSSAYKYVHEYDNSITETSIVIKSNDDIVYFYSNFCSFSNAEASVMIPNTITQIGNATFAPNMNSTWNNLVDITIPSSVTAIGSNAFEGCSKLKKLVIPNSVNTISEYMCKNCPSLEFVSAKSVETISHDAFAGCSKLSNVELNNVVTIAYSVFYGCSSLVGIKLPSTLKTLGNGSYAFYENTRDINYNGTKSQWESVNKGNFWSRLLNTPYTVHCTDSDVDYTIVYNT